MSLVEFVSGVHVFVVDLLSTDLTSFVHSINMWRMPSYFPIGNRNLVREKIQGSVR